MCINYIYPSYPAYCSAYDCDREADQPHSALQSLFAHLYHTHWSYQQQHFLQRSPVARQAGDLPRRPKGISLKRCVAGATAPVPLGAWVGHIWTYALMSLPLCVQCCLSVCVYASVMYTVWLMRTFYHPDYLARCECQYFRHFDPFLGPRQWKRMSECIQCCNSVCGDVHADILYLPTYPPLFCSILALQESHQALLDALMEAYIRKRVTIEGVVRAVR